LKILHVIDSINLRQGGPSVSVPALAAAQAKLGHEVTIACRDYEYLGPVATAEGVKVHTVPGSRWIKGQGGWGCGFRKLIEEGAMKTDVIHNHGVWLAANYYARRAAVKAGKPLVSSPRGMLEEWSLGRAKLKKGVAWWLFERKNIESAALFHATSESEAEAIASALRIRMRIRIKEPKIIVAPNGVDVPEKIPGREVSEKRFPKLKGKKWIVFMSRIHPKKGLLELAEAWMTLREKYSEWVLVIAGPEDDREYAGKVREELKGEGVWMGELTGEEKWSALGNAGFVALPTYSENFGIVVAETLAAGRPVLTTTGTPWGTVSLKMKMKMKEDKRLQSMNLEERGCGVICEVGGVKGAMEKMLGFSDKQRDEMGKRGVKWMREEFSWGRSAKELVEAYQGIV